ncbi:VWA domain-containing protein [Bacillus subtilis]|nr:VWA domain-containing protein [Bacillus subtilis]
MRTLTDTFLTLGIRLRAAGLPADPDAVRSLITAAACLDPLDPQQVRAASRALTCTRPEHLRLHDAIFDAVFGLAGRQDAEEPSIDVEYPRPEMSTEGAGGEASEITEAARTEHLRHVDLGFEHGSEAAALIDGLVFRPPRGLAHRTRSGHTGIIDAPRILRRLIRNEEISTIPRRRSLYRRRPVTLVADVSASMTVWREPALRFLARGSAVLGARCFTAGTRLTRVDLSPRAAAGHGRGGSGVASALDEVLDAGAGTRLGDSLTELLSGRMKDLVRGSTLVVISDGWEHGDCTELDIACARLARLSHRFLWVNPRAGRAGFEARTRGLAVAAAHAEAVLPATTVAQWQRVADFMAARASAHGAGVVGAFALPRAVGGPVTTVPATVATVPTATGQEARA